MPIIAIRAMCANPSQAAFHCQAIDNFVIEDILEEDKSVELGPRTVGGWAW